ncbi:hypothetical protein DL93DRAFT_2091987 [Clavulina sp. PMI_390]|nr:hypothetical protein DL93DRAFT_2091987 [Clavulina sp. PMI_390]
MPTQAQFPRVGDLFSCAMVFLGLAIISTPKHTLLQNHATLFHNIAEDLQLRHVHSIQHEPPPQPPTQPEIFNFITEIPQSQISEFWALLVRMTTMEPGTCASTHEVVEFLRRIVEKGN